ncbi:Hypothetical protein MVR_LOCUS330 [uncultured virus]|nr:Hypothetical protein MVR_LOCUS330 [uncultured virus]
MGGFIGQTTDQLNQEISFYIQIDLANSTTLGIFHYLKANQTLYLAPEFIKAATTANWLHVEDITQDPELQLATNNLLYHLHRNKSKLAYSYKRFLVEYITIVHAIKNKHTLGFIDHEHAAILQVHPKYKNIKAGDYIYFFNYDLFDCNIIFANTAITQVHGTPILSWHLNDNLVLEETVTYKPYQYIMDTGNPPVKDFCYYVQPHMSKSFLLHRNLNVVVDCNQSIAVDKYIDLYLGSSVTSYLMQLDLDSIKLINAVPNQEIRQILNVDGDEVYWDDSWDCDEDEYGGDEYGHWYE